MRAWVARGRIGSEKPKGKCNASDTTKFEALETAEAAREEWQARFADLEGQGLTTALQECLQSESCMPLGLQVDSLPQLNMMSTQKVPLVVWLYVHEAMISDGAAACRCADGAAR